MAAGAANVTLPSALTTTGLARPGPGVSLMRASGRSMYPTIHPGDWLFVAKPAQKVRLGDVAILERDGEIVVHRILSVRRGLEQGDASQWPGRFRPDQILGQVVALDRNGRTKEFDTLWGRARRWYYVVRGYGGLVKRRAGRCLATTRRDTTREG